MPKLIKTGIIALYIIFCFIFITKVYADTILDSYLKDKGINIKVSSSLSYYDKYVWRGMLLDNDSVLQESVTISGYGFEGGFWGNRDMESHDGLSSDEADGWISYGFDMGFFGESFKKVNISVGHTWYSFPETDGYSKELYLTASLDAFLSPYITYYLDYVDESQGGADGIYVMVGISHSFNLSRKYGITLNLGQEFGYNKEAFIKGEGEYSLTTLGATIPLTKSLTMTPNIGYSIPFNDLADKNDGNYGEQFYGGISFGYDF